MDLLNKLGYKEKKPFTEKQLEAIELLARKELENWSMEYIGNCVGVTRKTIHEWLKNEDFKRAVNERALLCLADYSPVVLKNASDFLYSKDEKIKIKGVELVMKSVEAQEKAKEEAKKKQESQFDVDIFLNQLAVPDDIEGMILYYQNKINELKELQELQK